MVSAPRDSHDLQRAHDACSNVEYMFHVKTPVSLDKGAICFVQNQGMACLEQKE